MKKTQTITLFLLLFQGQVFSQYYYKDLLTNAELRREMETYKANKVRRVDIRSFEDDGSPSKGFFCKKSISRDYRSLETGTRTLETAPSLTNNSFDEDGRVLTVYDSSEILVTSVQYSYDNEKRLSAIVSVIRSADDDFVTEVKEEHIYRYGISGKPERMLLILNSKDTTVILFSPDEKNNVALEKNTATGNVFYYYYDESGRLTDIVRESGLHGRMIPDYIFAYDEAGRPEKMMSTEEGSANYTIWVYEYQANGLKKKEQIYSKEKRLLGTLEYDYQ